MRIPSLGFRSSMIKRSNQVLHQQPPQGCGKIGLHPRIRNQRIRNGHQDGGSWRSTYNSGAIWWKWGINNLDTRIQSNKWRTTRKWWKLGRWRIGHIDHRKTFLNYLQASIHQKTSSWQNNMIQNPLLRRKCGKSSTYYQLQQNQDQIACEQLQQLHNFSWISELQRA